MTDTAGASETAQILNAIGGLGGLITAIITGVTGLIVALVNRGKANQAKVDADKAMGDASAAKTEADKAKTEASAAKADAGAAMAKALDAIKTAEDAQTKAQIGWLELQLRVYLSSRRDKIHEVTRDFEGITAGRKPEELSDTDKMRMAAIKPRFISAHEDFLGALEQACRHLEDEKIEVAAFRRMYEDEIRTVCEVKEGHPFYSMMFPEKVSRFKAIWTTYDKWFVSHLVAKS